MGIRVGVIGAAGRMGREVCRAVATAEDLDLVALVDSSFDQPSTDDSADPIRGAATATLSATLQTLIDNDVAVAVDFTHPSTVGANTRWLLENGIHAVVGTTGLGEDDLAKITELATNGEANCLLAPNFAIGAVLMMHVAQIAAKYMPHVEVMELHHDNKADAPSGTALRTAELIAAARSESPTPIMGESVEGARGADVDDIRVHSIRLPGLVAHQEVLFGAEGQTLSIRHDSIDRTCFMPGVLLGIRAIAERPGLTVGLEHLLDL